MKKFRTLALGIAISALFGLTAMALPSNTVLIGNNAYSLDYFFEEELPSEINDAVMAGGSIFYDVGTGFIDAWEEDAMTQGEMDALVKIPYLNADGTRVVYEDFYTETPTESAKAQGQVQIATIGSATIVRLTVTNSEVGTKFRVKDDDTISEIGTQNQFNATSETVEIELLDDNDEVVGTISVVLSNGSFDVPIELVGETGDDFEVDDII